MRAQRRKKKRRKSRSSLRVVVQLKRQHQRPRRRLHREQSLNLARCRPSQQHRSLPLEALVRVAKSAHGLLLPLPTRAPTSPRKNRRPRPRPTSRTPSMRMLLLSRPREEHRLKTRCRVHLLVPWRLSLSSVILRAQPAASLLRPSHPSSRRSASSFTSSSCATSR